MEHGKSSMEEVKSANGVVGTTQEKQNRDEINEVERSKIEIMRALVEREDPSSKEVDDFMIWRFLRARELNIEKASAMFLKYLSWRRPLTPNGFISPSDIPNGLAQNKVFMQGYIAFVLDRICSRMPPGQEKFLSIADLEGWGYANSDVRGYLAALSILQIVFVEEKNLTSTLLAHVDEDQLPEVYGGKLPLVPVQDA